MVVSSEGYFYSYSIDLENGGECALTKQYSCVSFLSFHLLLLIARVLVLVLGARDALTAVVVVFCARRAGCWTRATRRGTSEARRVRTDERGASAVGASRVDGGARGGARPSLRCWPYAGVRADGRDAVLCM